MIDRRAKWVAPSLFVALGLASFTLGQLIGRPAEDGRQSHQAAQALAPGGSRGFRVVVPPRDRVAAVADEATEDSVAPEDVGAVQPLDEDTLRRTKRLEHALAYSKQLRESLAADSTDHSQIALTAVNLMNQVYSIELDDMGRAYKREDGERISIPPGHSGIALGGYSYWYEPWEFPESEAIWDAAGEVASNVPDEGGNWSGELPIDALSELLARADTVIAREGESLKK